MVLFAAGLVIAGCQREVRPFRPDPPLAETFHWTRQCELEPGTLGPVDTGTVPLHLPNGVKNAYEENAYALSEGKRLFSAFNCTGCHAHGGGDGGPRRAGSRHTAWPTSTRSM